jgi:Flp pilus assembly pilin Flp
VIQHRNDVTRRFVSDESGLSKVEWLGLITFIASLLYMVTPIREFIVNTIGIVFGQVDEATGEINDFSTAMRGIAIFGGAVIVFIGSGWLLLWTNLGTRLAFLLTGAATFGWLTINGILFVVYAPRGIRPNDLEGLNALQIRLPSLAMALGSFILFLMFTIALSRYESDSAEA